MSRPKRVLDRNRNPERDGPDPAQAESHTPTKVRIQFSFLNFQTTAYDVWRGAAIKVVAANAKEAHDLYNVVKAAAEQWWKAQNEKAQ